MHPEIKKFWEDTGHELSGPSTLGVYALYIPIDNSRFGSRHIQMVYYEGKYIFNKERYSEQEMLRIIKQKAFL